MTRRRRPTTAAAALAPLALLAGLAGCSAVGDAASAAGGSASAAAVRAAQDAARQQLCGLVADGTIDDADLRRARAVVATAKAAGVHGDLIDSAQSLLGDGASGGAPPGAVARLQQACRASG